MSYRRENIPWLVAKGITHVTFTECIFDVTVYCSRVSAKVEVSGCYLSTITYNSRLLNVQEFAEGDTQ